MSALAILAPHRFLRLLAADARNVLRDPMLAMASILSLIPSIGLWLARPAMDEAARTAFGVTALSTYAIPVVLLLPMIMVGWVGGFLFLEDRDDGPLVAIEVTPIGKLGFMIYRLVAVATITAAITLLAVALLLPDSPLWLRALLVASVPVNAMLVALILPAVARNKVEGLAVTKLINLAAIAPLLALAPTPFRFIGGLLPTYWFGEWLSLSDAPLLPLWVSVMIGALMHLAALLLAMRLNGRGKPG